MKNDAPRFPGARVSSDQAVSLAAAGTAVAGAAFAATVGAGAGGRGRGREGQAGNRQKCDDEFFHFGFSVEVSFQCSFRQQGRKPTPGEPSGSRRGNGRTGGPLGSGLVGNATRGSGASLGRRNSGNNRHECRGMRGSDTGNRAAARGRAIPFCGCGRSLFLTAGHGAGIIGGGGCRGESRSGRCNRRKSHDQQGGDDQNPFHLWQITAANCGCQTRRPLT